MEHFCAADTFHASPALPIFFQGGFIVPFRCGHHPIAVGYRTAVTQDIRTDQISCPFICQRRYDVRQFFRLRAPLPAGIAEHGIGRFSLFRILFVLFTVVFTFGFWRHGIGWRISMGAPTLYVILWICMPAAKTVRQRWEQRGEDGTLNSIQRSVEAGAKEFEEAVKSVGQSSAWNEFANIFGKLIGLVLLIVGFAGLFTGSLWGFGSGWFGHRHGDGFLGLGRLYDKGLADLHMYAPQAAHALAQPGVNILIALVCFLPFLGILYGALQLLFGFKAPKWHPGLVIFILWLLAVVALGILIATGFISTELLII